ncbi:hypothetical protein SRHO_G00025560 [Serrasalmus rhombeus]
MGRPSCRFADLIIASEIIIFRRRRRRVSLLARTKSKSTPQHRPSAHQLTPCPIMIKQESKELLNKATALAHAEKLLRAEGIPALTHQLCLGKLVVPFGQYENALFRWLVANNVGYMKYIINKHRSEVTNPHRKAEILSECVKDFLTEYAESFPQVSIVLEANIDRCIYGQRGFEDHTFQEMWELCIQYPTQKDRPEQFSDEQRERIQKVHRSVRRWLHTPVTHIRSVQMKRFRKYTNDKDRVELEGWVHLWENPNDIPSTDISWLKEDTKRGLFKSTGTTLVCSRGDG